MAMLVNRRTVRIEWGDCDPAGIVFYPRYFEMFDSSTGYLFERALGMTKYESFEKFGFAGYPMLETKANFMIPNKFGDDVVIESTVKEFRRSSFDVHHRLLKGDSVSVEGFETRVWVLRDPTDKTRLKSHPVPPEVTAKFQVG